MDCMKMWPWMRDLPNSVWAGRGWVLDANGLRRLTFTGGSSAMQGVEVLVKQSGDWVLAEEKDGGRPLSGAGYRSFAIFFFARSEME